ncbi:hypothetical protein WS62_23065 [Burkholderia sp. ABCPW 14]|nr:hypothetical protein WS62_23065 [Burkholderia sp. ABCPW 14]
MAKSIDVYRIAAQQKLASVTLGAYCSDSRYAAHAGSTFRRTDAATSRRRAPFDVRKALTVVVAAC